MLRNASAVAALLALAAAIPAQFTYDFNALSGSDLHPYVPLDLQDGWRAQTFSAANGCGVTATMSHDSTPCLRFQEVGPGYGCDASRINDANWFYPPFLGSERNASFQADVQVGYWGGSFGLAHDTNLDGVIRGAQPGERGVRFNVGTQANVQLKLIAADQTSVTVPLANAGSIAGGNWLRIRVIMDLGAQSGAGLGYVEARNLTAGATAFSPVPGLQGVPLGLNPAAADATNPALWDAMWLHFEGATYSLDNIEVGRAGYGWPFGAGCGGANGPVSLMVQGPVVAGGSIALVSGNHGPLLPGLTLFGLRDSSYAGAPLPLSLDPLLGTSGCFLFTSIDASMLAFTTSAAPATLSQALTLPAYWSGLRLFAQQVCLEPVPGGMSWSNGLLLQLQ